MHPINAFGNATCQDKAKKRKGRRGQEDFGNNPELKYFHLQEGGVWAMLISDMQGSIIPSA